MNWMSYFIRLMSLYVGGFFVLLTITGFLQDHSAKYVWPSLAIICFIIYAFRRYYDGDIDL